MDAIRVTIVLSEGDDTIIGEAALDTIVDVHQTLQRAGDQRFPFIDFTNEEELASDDDPEPEPSFESRRKADLGLCGRSATAGRSPACRFSFLSCAFHLTLTAMADEIIGVSQRRTSRYGLVHRSVDHRAIRDLCTLVFKATTPSKSSPYLPASGLGQDILVFADAFINLQERRHRADYDVTARDRTLDARIAIATGRSGMARFRIADSAEKRLF